MVVDGGGILQYGRVRKSNFDTGEDVVSPYLWSRGIRRIDVLVATHAHEDHIGGLKSIMENFRPAEFWTGANPPEALIAQARALHIRVLEQHLSPPFDFSGARIQFLSPPEGYAAPKIGNNDSLAFRITYGSRAFLLTGDLERPMEGILLGEGVDLRADVLKVGHHGSKTSTMEPFLEAVAPSIAIISAGYENSFGHPHPDVIRRLEERHITVLRTDDDGLVTVRTDGRSLAFDSMAWGIPQVWPAPPICFESSNPLKPSDTIERSTSEHFWCFRRVIALRLSAILIASLVLAVPGSVWSTPPASTDDASLEIVGRYLDATRTQQEVLRGAQMEMNVHADLPKLGKAGHASGPEDHFQVRQDHL